MSSERREKPLTVRADAPFAWLCQEASMSHPAYADARERLFATCANDAERERLTRMLPIPGLSKNAVAVIRALAVTGLPGRMLPQLMRASGLEEGECPAACNELRRTRTRAAAHIRGRRLLVDR